MKIPTCSLALLGLVMSACTSSVPKNAITLEHYTELAQGPALKAKFLETSCTVLNDKGDQVAAPRVTTKPGQTAEVAIVRDFHSPSAFDLPQTKQSKLSTNPVGSTQEYPITPATTKEFDTREVGLKLKVTPRLRGPFIELSGTLSETVFLGFARGAGEALSPICNSSRRYLFTENRAPLPQYQTTESQIYVVGLPGVEHRIDYQGRSLILKCELIK